MEEETNVTDNKQSRPWLYKKGQSGNPAGRPKGSRSLKSYVKDKFAAMTDEEFEEYMEGLDKKTIWEMGEGKAKQDVEVSGELVSKVINIDE